MTLLVLAGTEEARVLCQQLQGGDILASLAGVTRKPKDLGVPTHIGGFGGAEGFRVFLQDNFITAVCDATHPFAKIGHRTTQICAEQKIPYVRFMRPAWPAETSWIIVSDLIAARAALPSKGAVFLATGAGSVENFAGVQKPQLS